ncbi:MAG: lmo0937 family membrane protein [Armatimonadetes bacterium]|nr:lmo0937 family membrane protein [Armatimonadota bacterium]
MWWTIAIVLLILWLLGLFAFEVGALIHVLLVVALVIVVWRLITGRKVA